MDKKYRILVICAAILFLCFVGTASAKTWYVDDDGGANFTRIQDAITAARDGDTIIVRDGTYNENVDVNVDNLTIQSENGSANCIVQAANSNDHVFEVTTGYVNISGFTVKGATAADWIAGIYLDNADHCAITNNICTDNNFGIHLYLSGSNVIENNICNLNNHTGIKVLWFSSSNILTNNTCSLNSLHGIDLFASDSNTLSNNTCDSNNVYGIFLFSSESNTLTNNNNSNNKYGICLSDSNDNTLTNNTMSNNNYNFGVNGISSGCYINNIDTSNKVDGKPIFYLVNQNNVVLDASTNAGFVGVVNSVNVTVKDLTLTNNGQGVLFASATNSNIENVKASNNEGGIYLVCSRSNILRKNSMSNNKYNFHVSGGYLDYYIHDIDTSNKINGKPMYYLVDQNNVVINASKNAGYVGVVNSTNITIKDLTLTNNYQGVFFAYTTNLNIENINASNNERGISLFYSSNSILTNNTCSNNDYGGIHLFYTSNNTIENNTCNSNYDGISLWYSCNNSLLKNNNCSNNTRGGINHWESSNNTLTNNNCLDNGDGIYFWVSSNNTLTNNNCSDNDDGIHLIASSNNTLTGNNCSNNHFGIFLADTSNNNTLTNNNCLDNDDGIHLGSWSEGASNNHLTSNNCSNNECGIGLCESSNNNTLTNNIVSNNSAYGIHLYLPSPYFPPYSPISNNTFTGNTVSNNRYGICLNDSYNNIVYLNNFMNNDDNVYSEDSTNIWNSTKRITCIYNGSTHINYLGNYWDDYKEKYPDAEEIDRSGIWNMSYSINSDNDTYPLVEPFENYFAPTENIFDTGSSKNPYPSIFGTHNGTITPNKTITVHELYTYPCPGTGGHTEYAKIYNDSLSVETLPWEGYKGDWHNISFNQSFFTLVKNKTYNYTIVTVSYPQIHHTDELEVASGTGTITCDKFVDANGRKYNNWIPAIKFFC
jgi:parallel beta-helix repeat protein